MLGAKSSMIDPVDSEFGYPRPIAVGMPIVAQEDAAFVASVADMHVGMIHSSLL